MTRNRGVISAAWCLAGACCWLLPLMAQAKQDRPNILFLFTDDQRFDTVQALGNGEVRTPRPRFLSHTTHVQTLDNGEVRTPHMDRLAQSGLSFTRAHIMGSTRPAVCMPSRAMLMTGRTLFHLQGSGGVIPPEQTTLPQALRKAGYVTFATGKWHNDSESFARSFTCGGNIFMGGMADHLKVPVHDFDPSGQYRREDRRIGEKFSSELFSDAAVQFLEGYKGDQPFFMYVSYTAPHDPRMAPKRYADMYPPSRILVPKNFLPEHPFDNGELRIRDELLAPFPRTPEIVQQHIAAYYAMITHVDAQIGRVLKALEKSGKADNTLIVFSGDNGLAVGRHGLMGKQNLYEHSVRVPLILSGPGIPRGQTSDALCYLLDLFPTLCDLAHVPVPGSVDGKSLADLARGGKTAVRDSVYYAYRNVQRGVRTDRWKMIRYNVNGRQTTQVFDLRKDPWELNNLAEDPSQTQKAAELTALMKQWMSSVDDPCDLDQPGWGCSDETDGTAAK